jgi:hypothetical protein
MANLNPFPTTSFAPDAANFKRGQDCRMVDAAGLLFRPVAADNAEMEAEPIKAEPQKPKRRWFQFRLRTLMLAATVAAVICAVCLPSLRAWLRAHTYVDFDRDSIEMLVPKDRPRPVSEPAGQ